MHDLRSRVKQLKLKIIIHKSSQVRKYVDVSEYMTLFLNSFLPSNEGRKIMDLQPIYYTIITILELKDMKLKHKKEKPDLCGVTQF